MASRLHSPRLPTAIREEPWMPSLLDQIKCVPVGTLIPYPGNPRHGNIAAISESLRENLQYAPLVVQASTRYVLAGNHTLEAAQRLGWPEIDVVFIDVGDDRARRILVSSNRTADLGDYDDRAQAEILTRLGGDLAGTGYDDDDLDGLLQLSGILGQQASSFLDDIAADAAGDISAIPDPGGPPENASGLPAGRQPQDQGSPAAGNTAGAQAAPGPVPVTYVQVAWTVAPGDRDVIRQALRAAQDGGALETQAQALVAVARHYLNSST